MAKLMEVRVFVVISADGSYSSAGWSTPGTREHPTAQHIKDCAYETAGDDPCRGYWLIAALPIPDEDEEASTVSAIVTPED